MTEELWQKMAPFAGQKNASYLALAKYPEALMFRHDASAEQSMEELKGLIASIRARRVDLGITPSTRVPLVAKGTVQAVLKVSENEGILKMLCHLSGIVIVQEPRQQSLLLVLDVETNKEEEKIKLLKELDRATQELRKAQHQLSNPEFCANAPESVVQKEQMRVQQFEGLCAQARGRIESL